MTGIFFRFFEGHTVSIIILSILLISFFVLIFVRQNAGNFLLGVLKTLASIFYCPILYLKKLMLVCIQFYTNKTDMDLDSKQYLSNIFIIILNTIFFITSIVILSVGLIRAWDGFLPNKYLRERATLMEKDISEINTQLSNLTNNSSDSNKVWNDNRENEINKYKSDIQSLINSKREEMQNISNDLSANDNNTFISIKNYLNQNSNVLDSNQVYRVRDIAMNMLSSSSIYSFTYEYSAISNYINIWNDYQCDVIAIKKFDESLLKTNYLRNYYSQLNSNIINYQNQITELNSSLNEIRPYLKYHFDILLLYVLLSIIVFIFFIWIAGLCLELFGLGINMALDLRQIRNKITQTSSDNNNP